jgi:hypothetical protein
MIQAARPFGSKSIATHTQRERKALPRNRRAWKNPSMRLVRNRFGVKRPARQAMAGKEWLAPIFRRWRFLPALRNFLTAAA